MNKIEFSSDPLPVKYAIAASFDLSGFSTFCRGPNAHAYLSRYLAAVFQSFNQVFVDFLPEIFSIDGKLTTAPRPNFLKYTGDGALMLWVRDDSSDFSAKLCTSIVLALRAFQQKLPALVQQWERDWRTIGLPRQARIGIAIGPVHPLNSPSAEYTLLEDIVDYVGYCINLAVRSLDSSSTSHSTPQFPAFAGPRPLV